MSRDPGFLLVSASSLQIGQILVSLLVSKSSLLAENIHQGAVDITGHMSSITADIEVCSVLVQQSPDGACVAAEQILYVDFLSLVAREGGSQLQMPSLCPCL